MDELTDAKMSIIRGDEECVLCLGTGWIEATPTVLGLNEDGSDILSEPKYSLCRCAFSENEEDDDDEEIDYDGDDEEDGPVSPYFPGGSLVLAN